MKRCLVRITLPGCAAWHYTGLFPSTFDAITHALILLNGRQARISARRLP